MELKFSFIIDIYENDLNLKKCLDSIIYQSFSELEINCIINKNDSSSLIILNEYKKMDNRINIFLYDEDKNRTINSCILETTAEYLFFIDSNGWFDLNSINDLNKILILSNPQIILFNFRKIYNDIPIKEYFHISDSDLSIRFFDIMQNKKSLMNYFSFPSLKIYKTSFLKNKQILFSNFGILDDIIFNIKTLLMSDEIVYFQKIFYNWENKDMSLSKSSLIDYEMLFDAFEEIKSILDENQCFKDFLFEYYEFIIKTLEKYLNSLDSSSQEVFLVNIKNFFKENLIPFSILKNLPFKQFKFYMHILNSDSLFEFYLLHYISFFNKDFIKKTFKNYGDLILKEKNNQSEISLSLLRDINNNYYERIDAFNKISELNLFDKDFYRENYNYNLDINPILHYIYTGYNEGYRPNEFFDADYYSEFNKDVKNSNLDPFSYFALYGIYDGKIKFNKNATQPYSYINKKELSRKILKFHKLGVTKKKREKRLIVSLTSFPERMDDIHFVLYSLLNQSLKPDLLVLWLARSQFPNLEKDLPQKVLSLKENGLTILWCDDLRSFKKLLPSLESFPNDIIVTADDDIYYPENWLKELYNTHIKYPNDIISHRSRKIILNEDNSFSKYNQWKVLVGEHDASFLNFATNGAGSLFPTNSLNEIIKDYDLAKELCNSTDDIWFWGMAVLNRTKTRVVKNNMHNLTYVNPARDFGLLNKTTLWQVNSLGQNDENFKKLLNKFPEIKNIILKE